MSDERSELLYKVLVVGDVAVGKTSFVKRYAYGLWQPSYKSTIGVDFSLKEIYDVGMNTTVRVQLWDVAGQERFKNLTRVYYKEAVAAVIIYDATSDSSFEGALEWKTDIEHKVFTADDTPIPCILVANKCDLASAKTRSPEESERLCAKHHFANYFETSAKSGKNVERSINWLVQHVYNTNPTAGGRIPEENMANRGILTETREALPDKKKCSC
eukprot:TRINITY_DN3818_c0_g1_i1.p1 TRINITY_DN3818_c0_g1~~TRINITY_DN3818_c0_g1_i1.p1  ORF type:complete len:229 (+),score=62.34 TRINITY_DN3818_c0_g1_i1:45-689(+)